MRIYYQSFLGFPLIPFGGDSKSLEEVDFLTNNILCKSRFRSFLA